MAELFGLLTGLGALLAVAMIWFIWPILGWMFAPRGRAIAGIVLGLLLGPIGVVICFFLSAPGPTAGQRRKREARLAKKIREELRAEMEEQRRREPPMS